MLLISSSAPSDGSKGRFLLYSNLMNINLEDQALHTLNRTGLWKTSEPCYLANKAALAKAKPDEKAYHTHGSTLNDYSHQKIFRI